MFYERKISQSMREQASMACRLEVKSLDEEGVFVGYGSVFDVVDSQRDVVVRGAFTDTLKASKPEDIKLLWQHDTSEPIGVFEAIYEDDYGLFVKGRLILDVAKAREAYALLKSGAVTGLSIGYSPVRYVVNPDTQVREIRSLTLWEVSLVTFPANPAAQVRVVKQKDSLTPKLRYEIERMQRLIREETTASCQ